MSEKRKLPHDATPDVHEFHAPPETIHDIINGWGTYNIQATSQTENIFPLIGAGLPKSGKTRSLPKRTLKSCPESRAAPVFSVRLWLYTLYNMVNCTRPQPLTADPAPASSRR